MATFQMLVSIFEQFFPVLLLVMLLNVRGLRASVIIELYGTGLS